MILGFKQKFPDGTATNFKEKILSGTKIHSLRESDRFRAGMSIQMAYGVRTKHYQQFNKGVFGLRICVSVQRIVMPYDGISLKSISVDDKILDIYEMCLLMKNDGLTNEEFFNWFFPNGATTWEGFIIHWTDFRY